MSELAAAVGVTEMEKGYAFAAASAAARAADQALLAVKAAKAEVARKEQAAKSAAGAKQAAEREFVAFARKLTTSKEMSSEALQKAALAEDTLEAKAFDLGIAAEAAVAAIVPAKAALTAAEAKAAEAIAAKRAAADAYAKAKTEHVAAIAANEAAKRRDAKRPLPVSVFISRATQRLYVRQGYEPIFDMPVAIEAGGEADRNACLHRSRLQARQDGDELERGLDLDGRSGKGGRPRWQAKEKGHGRGEACGPDRFGRAPDGGGRPRAARHSRGGRASRSST